MSLALISLEALADVATLVGIPITIGALIYAIRSFRSADTAAQDAALAAQEAAATSAVQGYMQLRADHPKLGLYIEENEEHEDKEFNYQYGWMGSYALHTAEQIYLWKVLNNYDSSWRRRQLPSFKIMRSS